MTKRIVLSALLLVAATTVAGGQRNPNRPVPQPQRAARGQLPDSQGRNRAALEGQVLDRITQMARRQLGLNDAQVEKLRKSNVQFADRRRVLMEQERDIRMSLRDEMISGDSSRQRQVGDLMDRMVKAQRQRIDLLEQEQKDLATFLTPMQRARYFGMEEQLRRRVEQMRQDGAGGPMRQGGGGRLGRGRPGGPPNPDDMQMGGPPQGGGMRLGGPPQGGGMGLGGPPAGAGMRMGPGGGGPGGPPAAGQVRPRRPGGPPDAPPATPPIKP
jgi:hypothetical protein